MRVKVLLQYFYATMRAHCTSSLMVKPFFMVYLAYYSARVGHRSCPVEFLSLWTLVIPVISCFPPNLGLQVYMFDGVGLNSQADPEPVKKEIQVRENQGN